MALRHLSARLLSVALLASGQAAWAQTAADPVRATPAVATAVPPAPLPNEAVVRVPVAVPGRGGKLTSGEMVLTIARPDGSGPFPLVVMSHGRNSALAKRQETARFRYPGLTGYFVRRGFAVLMPTRLGYGDSGTQVDPEATALACDERVYDEPANAIAAQITAAITYAERQPWADAKRLILAGQSYGGFGSIAALRALQRKPLAVINFAGGAGGDVERTPEAPCHPDRIARIFAAAGKAGTVPTLWLYAVNDRYWGPRNPVVWHQAFRTAGGRGDLAMMPAVGKDGHNLLAEGFGLWRPRVDVFLAEIGLEPPRSVEAPPSTGFAALDDLSRVPFISDADKTAGYAPFLKADVPRAFAVSSTGAWSWRTGAGAMEKAQTACNGRSKVPCRLYAVDDAVVWIDTATAAAEKASGATAGKAVPVGTGTPGKTQPAR